MAAIDKQQLERLNRIAAAGAVVQGDVLCSGCKYNLKGLPRDGRCPECGLPVHVTPAFDAPLSEMPRGVIVSFTRAAWFATICVGILFILVASTHILESSVEINAAFVLLSFGWVGATWMLTPSIGITPAISRGFSRRGRLRLAARVLQIGWVQAATAYLLLGALPTAKLTGSLAETLGLVQMSGIVIGLAGTFVLGLLLQRLAEWARDTDAENALNLALWGVPITTVLLFLTSSIWILAVVLFGIWAVAVCAFPYALLSLCRSLTWSIRHAGEYQDRLRRQRQRANEYQEEVSGAIDRMDAARERPETHER